jgi:phosphate transport system substrate-binding protein
MKRCIAIGLLLGLLAGCAAGAQGTISVIAREEGSGTRSAFAELLEMAEETGDGTVETAEISSSTGVVLQTVAGDPGAIGYVSLRALDTGVKAVSVEGVAATIDAVQSGAYPLARSFALCYRQLGALGQDFLSYVQSTQGQTLIAQAGYIPMEQLPEPYVPQSVGGKLSISGSTSVAPVLEQLAEAYGAYHPEVTVDIQQTGSSAGILAALEGTCEIGMTSRDLTQEEREQGLTEYPLALDGIAVIVHPENQVEDLNLEQLRAIFTGQVTQWEDLGEEKQEGETT